MEIEHIAVRKASDTRAKVVEIRIESDLPPIDETTLEQIGKLYQSDAEQLADALTRNLPQGTLHRLTVELMSRSVSFYRGAMKQWEE